MIRSLLICTDLDRTLIPNGSHAESAGARGHFATLVGRPEVSLAYVTGRHRALVEEAIEEYGLPVPDFVIGDVGSTIYRVGPHLEWQRDRSWEEEIAQDWNGRRHADLLALLADLALLDAQEDEKQNTHKLSYYVRSAGNRADLTSVIGDRLRGEGVQANLIFSLDELRGVELLDVLPARVSKYHAITALVERCGLGDDHTVFSGDSGNDIEVLASPIPAVIVANARADVRDEALARARQGGNESALYVARGGFMGMNGNYSAGILEGIAHYHPETVAWMGFEGVGACG